VDGWRPPSRDQSMPGGVFDRALTLADCQAACAQRFDTCVAINVVRRPNSNLINCYLVYQLRPLIAAQDVDNYEIIVSEECQVTSEYSSADCTEWNRKHATKFVVTTSSNNHRLPRFFD